MTATPLRLPGAADVATAQRNLAGFAIRTPLFRLNAETPGRTIHLKLENLQPLGSFKIRPGVNMLKSLDAAQLQRGVLTASAGNFGQGVAFAARALNVPVTAIVPETAAATKASALAELGAKVVRVPFDDWWTTLTTRRFPGESGVFLHPVAENPVLAGNATIAVEILEQQPEVDTIIVPFGGGGLVSGIASVMRRQKPSVRMIVVESEAAQPASAAFAAGHPVRVPHRQSFVDGMGSSCVLEEMWPLLRELVDGTVCVSFAQITQAIRLLAARHHVIAEAAGAAAVAAACAGLAGEGNIVCIVSGGNIDPARLAGILNGENPF
jgi:threonine dehydratase